MVDGAPAGRHRGTEPWIAISSRRHGHGDREAYADLIRVRGDRLFAIAQRILRDVDRTEDAVQEALVIAWRDLPGLRDPDRFDAWLHRLVVRACLAEAVRERRHVANLRVLPTGCPGLERRLPVVADRDQLERGFRRLPPEQRALLVLRHYAGCEPAEIAEILGIPAGTARSRLHHAHRAMRAALEADARPTAIGGQLGMTRPRDIERVLEAWFLDGPSHMPDRLFDAVLDRVERVPQRRLARLSLRFEKCLPPLD